MVLNQYWIIRRETGRCVRTVNTNKRLIISIIKNDFTYDLSNIINFFLRSWISIFIKCFLDFSNIII